MRSPSSAHDQALELLDGAEVRVGEQVDLDLAPLVAPHGREEVVPLERRLNVGGTEADRGHALGIDPDAHGLRRAPSRPTRCTFASVLSRGWMLRAR